MACSSETSPSLRRASFLSARTLALRTTSARALLSDSLPRADSWIVRCDAQMAMLARCLGFDRFASASSHTAGSPWKGLPRRECLAPAPPLAHAALRWVLLGDFLEPSRVIQSLDGAPPNPGVLVLERECNKKLLIVLAKLPHRREPYLGVTVLPFGANTVEQTHMPKSLDARNARQGLPSRTTPSRSKSFNILQNSTIR